MKLLIKNHKPRTARYNNQYHGSYVSIFKILEADSLGFVQEYWDESFEPISGTKNWVLELNTEPEGHKLEKILELRNVEEFNA
jgi:hypothetical protein